MPNMPCSLKPSIHNNSSKKKEIKKNLLSFEFYAVRAFKWFHSLFSTMNISIGQNCLNKKNPFEYIVPALQVGSEQLLIFGVHFLHYVYYFWLFTYFQLEPISPLEDNDFFHAQVISKTSEWV